LCIDVRHHCTQPLQKTGTGTTALYYCFTVCLNWVFKWFRNVSQNQLVHECRDSLHNKTSLAWMAKTCLSSKCNMTRTKIFKKYLKLLKNSSFHVDMKWNLTGHLIFFLSIVVFGPKKFEFCTSTIQLPMVSDGYRRKVPDEALVTLWKGTLDQY
jgi:hypothetical protein